MSVVEQALLEPADADGEPAAAATAETERQLSRASSELRDVLARLHTCLTLCSLSTRWHRPRKTPKMYTPLCCGTVPLTR